MRRRAICCSAAILTLAVVQVDFARAGEAIKDRVAHARSAAPASISDGATIMEGDGTILQKGTNDWVCLPDTMPGDGSPMCNDPMWMKMLGAVGSKKDFKADGVGVSYMLRGDSSGGGVSNSDPYHPDPSNADDYVETGPHLMVIVPVELLEGMTDDPKSGGPWVMWKDTPYAHLMVPIAE